MNDLPGISAIPTTTASHIPNVFVALELWSPNGAMMQSLPLSMHQVDVLIDELIEAQRLARAMAKEGQA